MVTSRRHDLLWGYTAQALNIGAGLLLLPIILHYLPSKEVGLWFVFITLVSLAQLLELGFQPTIARNVAYLYAGVQSLLKKGIPLDVLTNEPLNTELLSELVAASRIIYRFVALFAAILLLGGGSWYISTLLDPGQDTIETYFYWNMFAFGYVITFYYGYFNGLLQGRGDVAGANKVIIITRGSFVIIGATMVIIGFGLGGLGVASVISAVIGRYAAHKYYYSSMPTNTSAPSNEKYLPQALLGVIWHNAWRQGVVQLGAFLIQRANILIASSFLGLSIAASYAMTATILFASAGMANTICQIRLPYMNALQALGDKTKMRKLFVEIIVVTWILYLASLLILLSFGENAISTISNNVHLLTTPQIAFFGVIVLLELNHSVAASYLTTKNHIPFLGPALVSGLCIAAISLTSVEQWGVWGLLFAQGVVQLVYNNWKWPWLVYKELKLELR